MDRFVQQPQAHSQSTPALVHPSSDTPDSQDQRDRSALLDFLRREYQENGPSQPLYLSQYTSSEAGPARGETWLDFLRETESRDNTAGGSSSGAVQRGAVPTGESSEVRKRRLTAPENPGRVGYGPAMNFSGERYAARPTGPTVSPQDLLIRKSVPAPGSSAANSIDLTTGSPFGGTPSSSHSRRLPDAIRRRDSDIVLPPWQPDSDVTQCPVCSKQFSFYFRKHHCRKCGRVVCGSCSPHRITIPRQFIVQPPETTVGGSSYIDLTEDGDNAFHNPALGGGEEVRVCNPCVPDPNLNPPPQPFAQHILPYNATNHLSRPSARQAPVQQTPSRYRHSTLSALDRPAPFIPRHRTSLSDASNTQPEFARHRYHDGSREASSSLHQRGGIPDTWAPPGIFSLSNRMIPPDVSGSQRNHHHANFIPARSSSSASSRFRASFDVNAPLPPLPGNVQQLSTPSRREIAEEDECPVCANELPPKGPNGEENDREEHIKECIESSAAPSSSIPAANAFPHLNSPPNSAPVTTVGTPSQDPLASSLPRTESVPPGQRQTSSRARRHTGSRMLAYRATEKDCVGDDGEPAECVICFEEFEPGMEMGRLECWCKFHRPCIRKWWETKGPGSCPTHQLHD